MHSVTAHSTRPQLKIAYVHNREYPSQEANALQAIRNASAFSSLADTTFFIKSLKTTAATLTQSYNIPRSSLRIQPMLLNYLPDRFLLKFKNFFEQSVLYYLRYQPRWARFHGIKVLFVRDPKELLFWGLQKKHNRWFKDWVFIFEAHSTINLHLGQFQIPPLLATAVTAEIQYQQQALLALSGFDLVICLTQALADDLRSLSNGTLQPVVVRHASPLPRKLSPPQVIFGEKIVIGYLGQISQYKGVNLLLEAMRFLPQNYKLRLTGRFRQEKDVDPNWLKKFIEDPLLSARIELFEPIPIKDVQEEIDRCDIVVQPASRDLLNSKYEAPLKSFDYMVRGKPIVVADVPCHRELYQDGVNAIFYPLDPHSLADCITKIGNNPFLAQQIAHGAWEQGAAYNLGFRADTILSLAESRFNENKE